MLLRFGLFLTAAFLVSFLSPSLLLAQSGARTPAPTPSFKSSIVLTPDKRATGGYVNGEEVTITFKITGGSGVKKIHTAVITGTADGKKAVKDPQWNKSYLEIKPDGQRQIKVPFYLEYLAQVGSQLETTNKVSVRADSISPASSIVLSAPKNKRGYVKNEQVTVTFNATDAGSGVKKIHTAAVSGTADEKTARKNPTKKDGWNNGYKELQPGKTRKITVPFYLEYRTEDNNGNIGAVNKKSVPVGLVTITGVKVGNTSLDLSNPKATLHLSGQVGQSSGSYFLPVVISYSDGTTVNRTIKMNYAPSTISCNTDNTCPNGLYCAVEAKTKQGACVQKQTISLPSLAKGSYVILEDQLNKDDSGSQKALHRIEVEYNDCDYGGAALRVTKNGRDTYWSPGYASAYRFCVKEETDPQTRTTYLKSPGQPAYDWGASSFNPIPLINNQFVSYGSDPKNINMYLGKLGVHSTGFTEDNYTKDAGDLFYGLVPGPNMLGFYPDANNEKLWTVWINKLLKKKDSRQRNHTVWHAEVKPPERPELGGKILVRYVEDGYGTKAEEIIANLQWSVTEDLEWGANLPVSIKQISREKRSAWAENANNCWLNSPYNCDKYDSGCTGCLGVNPPPPTSTTYVRCSLTCSNRTNSAAILTTELVKKYEYLPTQKLNVNFVTGNSLTKNLTIKGSQDYRLRITTDKGEPYFGFIQIKVGNSTPVWNADGYPIFIGGQDIIIKSKAWSGSIANGRSFNFQMRTQVSNENIDVSRKLNNTTQPNIDTIPWSDTLTFKRQD